MRWAPNCQLSGRIPRSGLTKTSRHELRSENPSFSESALQAVDLLGNALVIASNELRDDGVSVSVDAENAPWKQAAYLADILLALIPEEHGLDYLHVFVVDPRPT